MHPAGRGEHRRDERRPRPASRAQSAASSGTLATAKSAEASRSAVRPAAGVGDGPREEEVERRAAALVVDGAEQPAERVPADEERERLVLVGRPRAQAQREEERDEPAVHAATPSANQRSARTTLGRVCGRGRGRQNGRNPAWARSPSKLNSW